MATAGKQTFTAVASYNNSGQTITVNAPTLTAYGAELTVSQGNAWTPTNAIATQYICSPVAATLSSGLDSDGSGPKCATYAWSVTDVSFSPDDGNTVPFGDYMGDVSNEGLAEKGSDIGSGTDHVNFDGQFGDAGYYIVTV